MEGETPCNCIIEDLIEKNFETRSFVEQENIVKLGRPIPKLNITKQTKAFVRHFQEEWYEFTPWLCGCLKLQKNFCWPCLLYSKDSNVWSRYGFDDLNNLSKARRRHEVSKSHIVSFIKLKQFEKQCQNSNSSNLNEINLENYCKVVTANRYIIAKLINIICYLSGKCLNVKGHSERNESSNRGKFVELVYLLSSLDRELKFHLGESTVFKEPTKKVQNDLIHSIGVVLTEEIIKEIKSASYVSLILNVITNVVHGPQLSTVFRYAKKGSGDIEERFIGFEPVAKHEDSHSIVHFIDNCYEKYNWANVDFVAHSYDGSAVAPNKHKSVQKKMKAVYKHSWFVHCYAHRSDQIFSQCLSSLRECQLFFQSLTGFSSFFSKCPKRLSALIESVKTTPEWNNYTSIINYIIKHKRKIKVLLLNMSENPTEWDDETAMAANGLHYYLIDLRFHFWLETFSRIFFQSNVLFDKLFKENLDTGCCNVKVNEFINWLQDIREDFDSMWDVAEDEHRIDALNIPANKRMRLDATESEYVRVCCKQVFNSVIDILSQTCSERYSDLRCLRFLSLLNVNEFKVYQKKFPEVAFNTLIELYNGFFDFPKLRGELVYLYSCTEFAEKSLHYIKNRLLQDNLHEDVLKELYSLIMLLYTMPCTSPPRKPDNMPTMERIESFLKNSQQEEELSSLALISIEKEFLASIQESTSGEFHARVIKHFAKKNPSIWLLYSDDYGK